MTEASVRASVDRWLDARRALDPALEVEVTFEPGLDLGAAGRDRRRASRSSASRRRRPAEVLGAAPPLSVFPGATDAPWFDAAGIPTIPSFGPGILTLCHGPNEYVELERVHQAARMYARIAAGYCDLADGGRMTALQSVAVNLQKWRLRRGVSVSALARAANVSKSTISELERNNGNPSLETLWALARALEIPLGFLFTDHDGGTGVRVVRQDEGSIAFEQPGYVSRLVAGWEVDGEVEVYFTVMDEGARRDSDSHGAGVIEHALVIDGRVEIGVGDELIELGAGRPDVVPGRPAAPLQLDRRAGPDRRHAPVPARPAASRRGRSRRRCARMTAPLRIGVIGAGNFAQQHLEAYARQDGVTVVAVADVDRGARRGGRREVGNRAVVRATAPSWSPPARRTASRSSRPAAQHREPTLAALAAGCGVLLEKPIATTSADVAAIEAAARASSGVRHAGAHPALRGAARRAPGAGARQGSSGRLLGISTVRDRSRDHERLFPRRSPRADDDDPRHRPRALDLGRPGRPASARTSAAAGRRAAAPRVGAGRGSRRRRLVVARQLAPAGRRAAGRQARGLRHAGRRGARPDEAPATRPTRRSTRRSRTSAPACATGAEPSVTLADAARGVLIAEAIIESAAAGGTPIEVAADADRRRPSPPVRGRVCGRVRRPARDRTRNWPPTSGCGRTSGSSADSSSGYEGEPRYAGNNDYILALARERPGSRPLAYLPTAPRRRSSSCGALRRAGPSASRSTCPRVADGAGARGLAGRRPGRAARAARDPQPQREARRDLAAWPRSSTALAGCSILFSHLGLPGEFARRPDCCGGREKCLAPLPRRSRSATTWP